MTTLRDVAIRAGVSTSTVSHVVTGKRFVSDEKRSRVMAAVRELRYEPNVVARSLKTQRSDTIGVVISDVSNPFFATALRGIEAAASQRGCNVILCDSGEDPEQEARHIATLRSRRVDGLIIVPASGEHAQVVRAIESGLPVAFLDREIAELDVSTAVLDNEHAAWMAVAHLIRHGHRRIGLITGMAGASFTVQQIAGYRRALQEAGITFDPDLVAQGDHTVDGGVRAMRALLGLRDRPTGLLAASDHPTIGALLELDEAACSVPGEIAVIGYSDSEWSRLVRPRLTAITRPTYALGAAAAGLLFDQWASGSRFPTKRVVLRCTLVVRETCGEHPTPDRTYEGTADNVAQPAGTAAT